VGRGSRTTTGFRRAADFLTPDRAVRTIRRAEPWTSASPRLGTSTGLAAPLLRRRLNSSEKLRDRSGASPYQICPERSPTKVVHRWAAIPPITNHQSPFRYRCSAPLIPSINCRNRPKFRRCGPQVSLGKCRVSGSFFSGFNGLATINGRFSKRSANSLFRR
jgi:hypothetical protein